MLNQQHDISLSSVHSDDDDDDDDDVNLGRSTGTEGTDKHLGISHVAGSCAHNDDDDMMRVQVEVKELKEQLSMLESATSLGALSTNLHGSAFTEDSITDLGIRKTLNFSTPDSTTRSDFVQI